MDKGVSIFIIFSVLLARFTKSAQTPFSAWLPAAIAAPTPVSALVHSSTLVTAGVYLIIRFFSRLNLFPLFTFFCFFFGSVTCFLASMRAIFENDMKKIIALSTLRQLGIITMAVGLGEPLLAFFHLCTHALFKALLFICAGSLIHVIGGRQDIRSIGSLFYRIPITTSVLNRANLSLCGFPFLAGFYSKDRIVERFFVKEMPLFSGFIILLRICLTAIYRIRFSLFVL